jgi:beta-ribofuranosylaminobenzene 5'-phosphate synthase
MLDRIAADVELAPAATIALVGADALDAACQAEVETLLHTLAGGEGRYVQAVVRAHAPQHVGLGTKTALKLAVIAAHDQLFGTGSTREDQLRLSGRGGASGIGVHGFFEGGVLWDAGQPAATVSSLLPSSSGARATPPVLMMRQHFPSAWQVVLCLPEAKLSHGADERQFFERQTPIPRTEALETMALLHHGVLPAFKLADLGLLAASLVGIGQVGFKRREIDRCGSPASGLLGELHEKGYAAGMSSMGPLVYVVVAGDDPATAADVAAIFTAHGAAWLGIHAGQNRGATIRRRLAR